MQARDVMTANVISVPAQATILEALGRSQRLLQKRFALRRLSNCCKPASGRVFGASHL